MDVDGVITGLKDKKVNPHMLQYIYQELTKNLPVGLNTGRSLDTVIQKIINPLTKERKDNVFLKNLIVVGEKGGTWMTFDDKGNLQKHVDESISISSNLQNDIDKLVNTKYSKSMFYDTTKRTMISTEMKDGYDLNKYAQDQKILIPTVKEMIKKYGLGNILEIEPNPIALDIQNKNVGKDLGAKRILNWLRARKIKVSKLTTIGDSKSDIKMAEEFNRNGFSVRYIHVGKKGIYDNSYPFEVITTEKEYDEGAGEYLNSLRTFAD